MTTKIPIELSSTPSIVDNGDATAITITSDEKVGIGTTSPSYMLTVKSSSNNHFRMENGSELGVLFLDSDGDISLWAHGDENIKFLNGTGSGTERMRIDSAGNVGIGTSSPASPLHIEKASSETNLIVRSNVGGSGSSVGGRLRLQLGAQSNSGSGNADTQAGDTLGQIMFEGQGTDYSYQGGNIICKVETGDGDDGRSNQGTFMSFETLNVGSVSPAEAMRITQSRVLAIGKSNDDSTSEGIWLRKHPTSGHGQIMCTGSGSSAYEGLYVRDISNSEMEFMASYHGTLYYRALASLSDERKKDNIKDITLGLDAVKELRPVSFDWKNDKGNDQLGFIAQEVETTSLKQLVSTYKDENIEDLRRLNKEGLIPVLVKAIQEQQEQIEALQSEINTLKGGE